MAVVTAGSRGWCSQEGGWQNPQGQQEQRTWQQVISR